MQNIISTQGNSQKSYAIRLVTFTLILVLIGAVITSSNFTSVSATESYSLIRQWGSSGSGNGQLFHPWSVSLDSSNHVYVDDRGNQRIQKFDTNGNFITKWNVGPTNQYPIDIAIDSSNNVYVAVLDNGINMVHKFTSDGTFIKKWLVAGNCCNDVQNAIAVDSSNNVYVSSNNHIFKFSDNGTFITSWQGSGEGQLHQITGIATDSSNNVYVIDNIIGRVEKFTSDGTFITSWLSVSHGTLFRIATDSSNNVYVADYNAGRVSKFTSDGNFITGWDAPSAYGVAVDPLGNVYVSSGFDNIQVYAPTAVSNPPHTIITSAVDGSGATITNAGSTFSSSIRFTFIATAGTNPVAGFECSIDNSAFSSCSSPATLTSLAVGKHIFQVRAVDTLGNRDPTPASFSLTIATITPPTKTTITSAVDGNNAPVQNGGTTTSSSIKIGFTATQGSNPIAGFQCSLDNSPFSSCTSPAVFNNLAAGPHKFVVVAVDNAGNRDPTPATFSWNILTPTQGLQRLIQLIQSMGLNHGTQTSLTAPLNAALSQLTSNNPNSIGTACNQLNAFINHVNADVQNGQLSSNQAAQLIQAAQAIRTALHC
jgi:streptogramin lyase